MDSVNRIPANTISTRRADTETVIKTKGQETKPQKPGGEDPKPLDSVALTQALASYSPNLKPGESVSIRVGKEEVAVIEKKGATNWDKFKIGAKQVSAKMMDVSKEAIETDPSFVFRETVEMAKEPLTQAAPEAIKELSLKGLYPGVRAGVLALDIRKAWKTLKDPKANLADKIVDVGHCLTDVGGLVGAAAPLVGLAIPGASILAATAIVGDIISFGYHTLMYVLKKAENDYGAEKEKETGKPQKPEGTEKPEPQKPVEGPKETADSKKSG